MTPEEISKDYEERAKAEREAGGSVEVNERFPYIGLTMSDGSEYFMQGEEAEKLIDEYWKFDWIGCSLEDYLLAIAQSW